MEIVVEALISVEVVITIVDFVEMKRRQKDDEKETDKQAAIRKV